MNRRNYPIVSVQLHPDMLEQIDCHSKENYTTRSETVRRILLKWYRDEANHIEKPPIFAHS